MHVYERGGGGVGGREMRIREQGAINRKGDEDEKQRREEELGMKGWYIRRGMSEGGGSDIECGGLGGGGFRVIVPSQICIYL